ncbi:MAG: hypothetical protein IT262_00295 [Saprospiraceae bacterium]|nr:hypothetical protein [Saprospiraceae bacterium]
MTTIKNFTALFLLVVIATVFNTSNASAQAGGNPKTEFFIQANDVDSTIAMLLPAIQKVRDAAARSFETILKNTSAVCRKVHAAGPRMSDAQLAGFQREFEGIDTQIARFVASQGTKGKSVEDCIRECGPSKNNPAAAKCKFECISGWLKAPGF